MSERGVDVEGLAGDLLLFFRLEVLERTHVVQAIGELDDDDADVGDHGEEHLADVLGLVVFAVRELDLVELGDAFDDVGDLLVEAFGDLGGGDVGVFDGVVQQAACDGGGVHLELGEDVRDLKGMDDVGLARGAELAGVLLLAELPGAADQLEVVVRTIFVDEAENLLEVGLDQGGIGAEAFAWRRRWRCGFCRFASGSEQADGLGENDTRAGTIQG